MTKIKAVKAWAILDQDEPYLTDCRMHIYWLKGVAENECLIFPDQLKVISVLITPIKPPQSKGKKK